MGRPTDDQLQRERDGREEIERDLEELVTRGVNMLREAGLDETRLDFLRHGWMVAAKMAKSSKDVHELIGAILSGRRILRGDG